MKLDRCVLAMLAVMGLAAAGTGCKSQVDPSDAPDQGPPAAQAPSDDSQTPLNADQDPKPDDGVRRARRHRGRHGHGRWRRNGGGNRPGPAWNHRGTDPQPSPDPQPVPPGPDSDDSN